ncbi:hypothetical protein FBEOM_4905 [Fusarium beomiforme]|uniref:Uncharacterized protein n=1 Tax=Fusarium beomiforme TaxID=44412 RepID=A0A9P5DXN9_9HYPO|nr:hypothetical protein FBEOM_4905 [Fusarium beomiforme]
MPLLYNKISFATVYDPQWRSRVARFDYLLYAQLQQQIKLIVLLGSRFLTAEMLVRIEQAFPWFMPHLREVMNRYPPELYRPGRSRSGRHRPERHRPEYYQFDMRHIQFWSFTKSFTYSISDFGFFNTKSCTLSAFRQAVEFTLRILSQRETREFQRAVNEALPDWEYSGSSRLSNFPCQFYKPWDISYSDDLTAMGRKFKDDHIWSALVYWTYNRNKKKEYRAKFRTSAASAAIRFLHRLPANKRMCIRRLSINEDHISVGRQECHAVGLIPFCQENPRLRISHQVSEDAFGDASRRVDVRIADWLAEVASLPKAGMPEGSYTFVLDGEPAIQLCSEVFQQVVLQREAMRLAMEQSERFLGFTLRRGLGDAFAQLVSNSSFITSNFNTGQLWDADRMITKLQGSQDMEFYNEYTAVPVSLDFSSMDHVPKLGKLLMENYATRPCARRPDINCGQLDQRPREQNK